MNLLYIANIRLPTEKAHGLQIMKTCEALAALGVGVTLLVPAMSTNVEDPFTYYEVERSFTIKTALVWRGFLGPRFHFLFQTISFSVRAWWYARRHPTEVLFSRDEAVLLVASLGAKRAVWESHTGSWNFAARRVVRRAAQVVVLTHAAQEFYTKNGVPVDKLVVVPDGVSLEAFAHPESKEVARARLGLPPVASIALYAGRVDGWKGVETLCAAAGLLPTDVLVVVIGGSPTQVEDLQKHHPRVRFLGARPYAELPDNQAAADVLVLPNTGKDAVSVSFTSPLKLFTYMASGKPIVASDVPSLREVLSEKNAFFATPDDPAAFAQVILAALHAPDAVRRAQQAQSDVAAYTWLKRGEKLLTCL